MGKLKILLRVVAFFAVFAVLLIAFQEWITPDWDLPSGRSRTGRSVRGVYNEEKNSLQVIWLGTSHLQSGVSPMSIYQATGIRSYNLSTTAQPLLSGYYRLKYVLKRQKPKLVIMDVGACFRGKAWQRLEPAWRRMIDALPWYALPEKLEQSMAMVSLNDSMGFEDIASGLLPILKYRYNLALTRYDFMYRGYDLPYPQKGQAVVPIILGSKKENLTATNEASKEKNRKVLDQQRETLEKINDLCKANGCELVLTKVPVNKPTSYGGYWSVDKHELIQELADEMGVRFIDLNFEDLDIDWKKETWDGGGHMNLMGALKVSDFYAQWLTENYDFDDAASDALKRSWDLQSEIYDYEYERLLMLVDYDVDRYLEHASSGSYTVLAAVPAPAGEYWSMENQSRFDAATGTKVDLTAWESGEGDARGYAMVASGGEALDADNGTLRSAAEGLLPDGTPYSVKLLKPGGEMACSVVIDGVEYADANAGIRLVVYDNDLHRVIDSVAFDASKKGIPAKHNNADLQDGLSEALLEYENATLKGR